MLFMLLLTNAPESIRCLLFSALVSTFCLLILSKIVINMINAFYAFVDGMDIEIKSIDKAIAERAAQRRLISPVGALFCYKQTFP